MTEPRPSFEYEHDMRVWQVQRAVSAQVFAANLTAVCGFANLAINSIILANSTAAGAVLVFIASLWAKPEAAAVFSPASWCVRVFAIGAGAGILAAGFSYFTQYLYQVLDTPNPSSTVRKAALWGAIICHVVAVAAALSGIAAFVVGAWFGTVELAGANGGLPKS